MTQEQCAKILNMSTRNYQNYEFKKSKLILLNINTLLKKSLEKSKGFYFLRIYNLHLIKIIIIKNNQYINDVTITSIMRVQMTYRRNKNECCCCYKRKRKNKI